MFGIKAFSEAPLSSTPESVTAEVAGPTTTVRTQVGAIGTSSIGVYAIGRSFVETTTSAATTVTKQVGAIGASAIGAYAIGRSSTQVTVEPYVENGYWESGYAEGDYSAATTTSVDQTQEITLPTLTASAPAVTATAGTSVTASVTLTTLQITSTAVSVSADASIAVDGGKARQTFAVTVANTGYGNKYYIDGVQQDSLSLHEEGIYRFDVSDSSVSGHPFKFSTTSNGTHNSGSEYTTNVTTVGTAGNAGAYVEIEVTASTPDLYYYCGNHSGMGGSIAFGVFYSQVPFIVDTTEFTADTQAGATASVSAGDNTLTAAEATATGAAEATFADSIEVGITAFASTETAGATGSASAGSASTTATSIAVSIEEIPDAFITSSSSSSLGVTAPVSGVSADAQTEVSLTTASTTAPAAEVTVGIVAEVSAGSSSTTTPVVSVSADASNSVGVDTATTSTPVTETTGTAEASATSGSSSTTSPAVDSTGTATVNVSSGSTTSTSVDGNVQGEANASGAFASASITSAASSVQADSTASAGITTASTSAPAVTSAAVSNATAEVSAGSTTSTSITGAAEGGAEAEAAASSVDLNASEPTVSVQVSATADVGDLASNPAEVEGNTPRAIVNTASASVDIVTQDVSFSRTKNITGVTSGTWTWLYDSNSETEYVFKYTANSTSVAVTIYSTAYDSSTDTYVATQVATKSVSRSGQTMYFDGVSWAIDDNTGIIYISIPFSEAVSGGRKVGQKRWSYNTNTSTLSSSNLLRSTIYGAVYDNKKPNTTSAQNALYANYFHTKDANYNIYYRVLFSATTGFVNQREVTPGTSFSDTANTQFSTWRKTQRTEFVTRINKEARYTADTLNLVSLDGDATNSQAVDVSDLPTISVTTLLHSTTGGATGSDGLPTLNTTALGHAEQGTADAAVSGIAAANLDTSIDASVNASSSVSFALDTLNVTAADVTPEVTEEPNSLPTLSVTAPAVHIRGNAQYVTPDTGLTLPTTTPEAGISIDSTATSVDTIAGARVIAPENSYNVIATNREPRNATALPPFATTGAFVTGGNANTTAPVVAATSESVANVSAGSASTTAPAVFAEGDSGFTITQMPTLTVTAPEVRADISVNVSVGSVAVTEPVDRPQGAASTDNEAFAGVQTQAPQATLEIVFPVSDLPTIYTGSPEAELTTVAQGELPTITISGSPSVDIDAEQNATTGPEYDLEIFPPQGYAYQYQEPVVDRLIIVARETRFIEVAEENRQVNVEFENRIIEVV